MELIFWQGIISIHQKTFLEVLAKSPTINKVILVVEKDITPYRKNMGWGVPQIEQVELIVSPSKESISKIFREHAEAVHIFGGIRVGKMITIAFDEGVKNKAKMGCMSEPYNKTGLKGKLRHIKYIFQKLFYFKNIDFFLAIGQAGVDAFTNLGYNPDKIFPWAYFVSVELPQKEFENSTVKRFIYAGRIEQAKGIFRFVKELVKTKESNYVLDIYGGGTEEVELKKFVTENRYGDKIRFFPFLNYNELIAKYINYDWVVLPSEQKDGWGVIISEGLLNGLKAICSNICGVSWVIKNGQNGMVFKWEEEGSCLSAIGKAIDDKGFAEKGKIRTWASKTISAAAGAGYFLEILDCLYCGKPKPLVPWEKNGPV